MDAPNQGMDDLWNIPLELERGLLLLAACTYAITYAGTEGSRGLSEIGMNRLKFGISSKMFFQIIGK